jgi:hypothetical protein
VMVGSRCSFRHGPFSGDPFGSRVAPPSKSSCASTTANDTAAMPHPCRDRT